MFRECDFLSGWLSGVAGIFTGHPLDTIKVRQQTFKEKSIVRIVGNTYKNEGIRGFYRGLLFPILAAGAYNSFFFGVYGNVLRRLEKDRDQKQHVRKFCCEAGELPPSWHFSVMIASGTAGAASVIIGCPIELVKTQLQSMTDPIPTAFNKKGMGPISCARAIYNIGGVRALYTGVLPMLLRDTPSFSFYMLSYEHIVCKLQGKMEPGQRPLSTYELLAGGLAGMASWVPLMPVDVVKSRIQADNLKNPVYKGMIDCITKSYKESGLKIFMQGVLACTLRAFPANAVTFYVYQLSLDTCEDSFQ